MAGIGIVNNPRSRRNQRSPETGRRLRALLDTAGDVADASTREELTRAVDAFRARDIDLLVVNGGDGTAHTVLTAFVDSYRGAPLPPVVLLRGGAMNTVADAHQLRGSPEAVLRTVLERRRAGSELLAVERDLLSVETDGGRLRYGFVFGTGAVVAFLDAYYASRDPSAASAASLLVRAFGSALLGGPLATSLTRRERLRVSSDGDEWPEGPYLGVIAGSIPEIGFGFKPFARCEEQPGFFHAVGVTGTILQIAAHLPRIWTGRPWKRSLAVDAVARELSIEGPLRFTIDGDLYEARSSLIVRTGPPIRLVVP